MVNEKRQFINITKTDYRIKLLEKAKGIGIFAGLDTATIFEKLLEIYTRNPAVFEEFTIDTRDIDLQEQLFLSLAKKMDELVKKIDSMDNRLIRIEGAVVEDRKEENLFDS